MTPMTTGTAVSVMNPEPSGEFEISNENIIEGEESAFDANESQPAIEESDILLQSAKDEGFEEALVHLAEGDFEIQVKEEGDLELLEQEQEPEQEVTTEMEELPPDEDLSDVEKQELVEKIARMDEQIDDLEEKTKFLSEKLKVSEANLKLSLETLLAMAQLMRELIKKEKSQKKKLSLLEFLLKFMGNFLLSIVDPEGQQKGADSSQNGQGGEREDDDEINFEELLKSLSKNGLLSKTDKQMNVDSGASSPETPQMAELAA